MFTNQYTRMSWPDNKEPMDLRGAVRDRSHAKMFLDRFTPGIRVEGVVDASRQDIEDRIEQIAHSCPPLLVVYFQGHSEGDSGPLRCKLVKMFSKLSVYTMSTVITDFCGSGNIYRLRFRLVVSSDGKYFEWYETNEWRDDNKANQKYRIASPMLHVAASLEWQSAYETEKRGGYLTNSLAAAELEALPRFLLHLRQGVNNHLQIAKAHPRRPLNKDATQYPQIYCTCKLVRHFFKHTLTQKLIPFILIAARRSGDLLEDVSWNGQAILF
ncbi:hypothetical protein B0J17DRAFT_686996 [Rhizoctonia solani]|nr:hypothetical protein B0J17DRAFT_686996 [Rhizoctonia solani]